jgi:hypothetical protein
MRATIATRPRKKRGGLSLLVSFWHNESGLVTLEWVALAAAVVVGGITLVWLVVSNVETSSAPNIGNGIRNAATTTVTQNAP